MYDANVTRELEEIANEALELEHESRAG